MRIHIGIMQFNELILQFAPLILRIQHKILQIQFSLHNKKTRLQK